MGSDMNTNVKNSYETISTAIMQLYTKNNAFHQKGKALVAEYKQIGTFLADKKYTHKYPNLENEINNIIGNWNLINPINQLNSLLKDKLDKLYEIDNEISKIEKGKQVLQQLPDRHNRKATIDKIDVFLKNVTTISVSQLDRVKDEVIPKVIQMIKVVQCGFETENENVTHNKNEAKSLLNRIDTYKTYVDKFGLYKIRSYAENVANEILTSPNCADPNSDKIKLQNANAELDCCDHSFEQETTAFKQMKNKLDSMGNLMWLEDAEKIKEILNDGATHNSCSAKELESMYLDGVTLKENELSNFLSSYSDKIVSYFQTDVDYVKENCVERKKLDHLRYKFDDKVAEDKKRLYIKIAKIVGIIAAVILFIVIMAAYWPWSGIILGIIVVLFFIILIKGN